MMEKDSPTKPSVAELAGRFKGHIIPMPTTNDESPYRRKTPCSLKLQNQKHPPEDSDKTIISPNPFKIKMKNSSIIEKLQANLALSPTALLPSPKSTEVKLQPEPLSPTTTCSPLSPLSPALRPSQLSTEEEDPVSFDSPPEGAPLSSINKTRARVLLKRRPPTRQHRRSAGEGCGAFGCGLSTCELYCPKENGDQCLGSPEAEHEQPISLKEAGDEDRDCGKTEKELVEIDPVDKENPEERQAADPAQTPDSLGEEDEPSEPCPAQQTEGDFQTEEEKEELQRGTHDGL